MKSFFRGYFPLEEKEIKEIWQNGFITFDTNVLFNLYRYSEETRKELLKIIRKYSKQIFLTHHCAYEFHKNRITVISEQIGIYNETIKSFQKLENDIVKNLKTPHLSKKTLENFEKILQETIKDLESKKDYFTKLLKNDEILYSISKIFTDKKIGKPFDRDQILAIEKEGVERYQNKIPPGFKDDEKKSNKYGDLIIWKELINESENKKIPFIFIIDDVKEDWWLRANGQTISPRPELNQELFEKSGQIFHLYTTDRFLEFASKTEEIQQDTIDEIREINQWQNSRLNTRTFSELIEASEKLKQNTSYSKLIQNLRQLNEINEKIGKLDSSKTFRNFFNHYSPSTDIRLFSDENIKKDLDKNIELNDEDNNE